jgi:hypothetical protein
VGHFCLSCLALAQAIREVLLPGSSNSSLAVLSPSCGSGAAGIFSVHDASWPAAQNIIGYRNQAVGLIGFVISGRAKWCCKYIHRKAFSDD